MSAPPSKRRKMRPNNPINKGKQSNPANTENQTKENQTDTTSAEVESPTRVKSPTKKTSAKSAENGVTEMKEKTSKTKAEMKTTRKGKKRKTTVVKYRNTLKEPENAKPLTSTPPAKVYESASDSDETDKEEVVKPTRKTDSKVKSKARIKADPKPKLKTDPKPNPKEDPKPKLKADPKPKLQADTKPTAKDYESASDSDETDKEAVKPTRKSECKRKLTKTKNVKKDTAMTEPKNTVNPTDIETSDADGEKEGTDAKKTKKQVSPKAKSRTSSTVNDSDAESESESESESNHGVKFNLQKMTGSEHLKSNRILFHIKKDYDQNLTPAENYKGRLNDSFVPSVKDDEFISDSESDTDSGEDYETREYPSWQRTLGLKHNEETDPWPKQRKFGYSDKLKLEKRIKKICKREHISFAEARNIFSSSKRGPYVRFFQKIAKAFPNMSLHALAKQCKTMYHVKRASSPWTPKEIAQLKDLIEDHGTSPTVLSKYMDRSPKNISDFLYNHMSTGKTNSKKWTPKEDEIIAKKAAGLLPGESFTATDLVPLFNGTRTPKQIHRRYRTIRHLIKKDGTIEPNRKATLMEELEYLKRLLKQAEELDLKEESQLDYSTDRGFVGPMFYLHSRSTINGFEKMPIKEILEKLIKRQERILESRRLEMALRPN